MEIDRNGLEVLTREACLRLLGTTSLGRVATSSAALPSITPVNFRLVGDAIVFRSSPGTKLDAAVDNAVVAFEVDDFDAMGHEGWSVLVVGTARVVGDPIELAGLASTPIARWAPRGESRVIAVSTELVTGRRLTPEATAGALVR